MAGNNWKLQPGVEMTPEVAKEVAKIACALKSLSVYTDMAYEHEEAPADLQAIVNDGLDAMQKIFVW